jgi:hypothetical protein
MKRSVSILGAIGILTLAGCGGSDSGSSSSGGSKPTSESGGSDSAAIAACTSYHASHVDVVPSDPASACACEIGYLMSNGHSSDELVTKLGDSVKQGTPLIMISQANLDAGCT